MTITLLGKRLEDYPSTKYKEEEIINSKFSKEFKDHNVKVIRHRLNEDFEEEILDIFVMYGNSLNDTHRIIATIRVIKSLGILTESEWVRAIPIIERGLKANKAYVKMLDELSPIIERYCREYDDVNMRHTFMERVHLEFWQGRFSRHWYNPNQDPCL